MASAYEELLADALDQMHPTSLMRMRADAEALFAKHPVQIEDIPEPGTKEAAIQEYNKCHNPEGDGGGQFCSDLPAAAPKDAHVERFTGDAPQMRMLGAGTSGTVGHILLRKAGTSTPARGWEIEAEGIIGSIRLTTSSHPDYLNIGNVNVGETYQRKGIGAWLYQQATAMAKDLGYKGIQSKQNRGAGRSKAADAAWSSLRRRGASRAADGTDYMEARVREFNDCNLPAGDRDGGRFGANADPRCAGGTGSQHYGPVRPPRGKALAKFTAQQDAQAKAKAADDALTAKYGPPTMVRGPEPPKAEPYTPLAQRHTVLADTFKLLSPENQQKMLDWSFAEGHIPRESMLIFDPTTGEPVDLYTMVAASGLTDYYGAIRDNAKWEDDGLYHNDDEISTRTREGLEAGIMLGSGSAVPLSPGLRDSGVTFHTHPGSGTFSGADVNVATTSKIQQMGVVGQDGTRYALRIHNWQMVQAKMKALEPILSRTSEVTASLLTGRPMRPGESYQSFIDEGATVAKAMGWDVKEVHYTVYSMIATGIYKAMDDAKWMDYGEDLSPARHAAIAKYTNGLGPALTELVRTHLVRDDTTRFRLNSVIRELLSDGRRSQSGVGVWSTAKEAAAALKDATWAALVEFNKCHNPAGDGGGQFCGDGEGASGGAAKGAAKAADLMPSMHAYADSTKGSLHERVVIIHSKTGEVLADYEQKLELTPDFRHEATKDSGFSNADMFVPGKESEYWPEGTILSMHTHPEPLPFSDGDWRVFSRSTIGEMRVASSVAEYRLEKTPEHFAMHWSKRQPVNISKAWEQYENEAFEEVQAGPHRDAPDWIARVLDGVSQRMATHFKVKYTVIPRPTLKEAALVEFNPCHEPDGPGGGQFTFKGTGNCDGEGQPTFAPSTKKRGLVKLHGHDQKDAFNKSIAKRVLGDLDPTALALHMAKYFDEDLTLRVGTSENRGQPYVRMVGTAPSGTYYVRVFQRHDDGTLSVTHEHFENHGPDAQGKALMQGQMEVYEKLGIETIHTVANISTGAYAWARYGFTATHPEAVGAMIRGRMDTDAPAVDLRSASVAMQSAAMMAASGRFTALQRGELEPYKAKIAQALANLSPTTPWAVADLRIEGSEEDLQPLVDAFKVRGNAVFNLSVKQGTRWNLQMRKEQIGGVFNLGRVLLTGLSWDAKLNMNDKVAMKRLRAFVRGGGSTKEAAIREFNKCHAPAGSPDGGQFCGDAAGAGADGGFDPATKATWSKVSGEWHTGLNGERPYGWSGDDPNYTVPAVTHKVPKIANFGWWGGSHSGSQAMTGESAAIMGIKGYIHDKSDADYTKVATRFLEEIATSPGSEEPLYHAFENVAHTRFTPGDTLKLPLTATAGEPETIYGIRPNYESQVGPPTVFAFPKGTKMMAYSKWPTDPKSRAYQDGNAQEFGHVYAEAIIAGRFKVTKVETKYFGSQHSHKPVAPGQTPQLYGQVVHLEPIGYFNPATGKWVTHG